MNNSVRVLPLLVVAGLCLFALKAMGLLFSGGYVISGVAPASAQDPNAVATNAQPATQAATAGGADKTTEAGIDPDKPADEPVKMAAEKTAADNQEPVKDKKKNPSAEDVSNGVITETPKSELAVLEGLANRRKDLDKRDRKIDLREKLLKAAEKRVEARIAELKTIEARIEGKLKKQDNLRKAQYENLVKMYSAMKPKNAARIFDRMELDILAGLATKMKPRVMSAIMAKMDPAAAERLTLEMATRGKPASKTAAALPKIESQKAN